MPKTSCICTQHPYSTRKIILVPKELRISFRASQTRKAKFQPAGVSFSGPNRIAEKHSNEFSRFSFCLPLLIFNVKGNPQLVRLYEEVCPLVTMGE